MLAGLVAVLRWVVVGLGIPDYAILSGGRNLLALLGKEILGDAPALDVLIANTFAAKLAALLDLDVGECAGSEIGLASTTTYAVQILGSLAVVRLNESLGSEEINLSKTHPTIVVGVGHGCVAARVLSVGACTPLPHEEILNAV